MDQPRAGQPMESTLVTALAEVDYPAYVVSDLINGPDLGQVYRLLASRRTAGAAVSSTADYVAAIRTVLDERGKSGLQVPTDQEEPTDDERARPGGFFPVMGPAPHFPPPVRVSEAPDTDSSGNGSSGTDSSRSAAPVIPLDLASIRQNVLLLRAEGILARWRGQQEPSTTAAQSLATLVNQMAPGTGG